jgi:hypothetical protein
VSIKCTKYWPIMDSFLDLPFSPSHSTPRHFNAVVLEIMVVIIADENASTITKIKIIYILS